MNKDTYNQTIIKFHSDLLLKELTDRGPDNLNQKFVEQAMESFVNNFNKTLAKNFLLDIDNTVKKEKNINSITNQYPEQFLNFKDGKKVIDNQLREDVNIFCQKIYSLGREMKDIKNESSGIPPRLLGAAKGDINEKETTAINSFVSTLNSYAKYDLDMGIKIFQELIHISSNPEFSSTVKNLLDQPITDKIIHRLGYENSIDPHESNRVLIEMFQPVKPRQMKP